MPQSPAVAFIEMGADALGSFPDWLKQSQRAELKTFGVERAKKLGASGLSADFSLGYELGLATARAVIAGNAALVVLGHVHPEDIL